MNWRRASCFSVRTSDINCGIKLKDDLSIGEWILTVKTFLSKIPIMA
jgi:hypothetical protein